MKIDYKNYIQYYTSYSFDVLKSAIKECLPISSIGILGRFYEVLCPETYYDDSDERKPDSLIVSQQNVDQVVKTLLQQRILLQPDNPNKINIQNALSSRLSQDLRLIEELNTRLGLQMKLAFNTSIEPTISKCPISAKGGACSFDSPLIYIDLPNINEFQIQPEIMKTITSKILAPYPQKRMEFTLAHESVHILHNDQLSELIIKTISASLTMLVWTIPLFQPISWASYIGSAFLKSLSVQIVSNLAYRIFSQYVEARADKEAMHVLNTNEGALQAFNNFKDIAAENDYLHPLLQKRIFAAQNWSSPKI